MSAAFWSGKTVLVTGHTGFKGGWLSLWLQRMGANVIGYALPPNTEPCLFDLAGVAKGMVSVIGDVRDLDGLKAVFAEYRPEIVFHLAAQPLVRYSYSQPVETFAVNVMGTVNVMEAARLAGSVRVCQIITTDKCYENREWDYAYREVDRLGGYDPYSSSKACAELAVASYSHSFFSRGEAISVSTVRAGNVIGGGDWAAERLVPDCIRALERGEPIVVRNPAAIRPWQHVLEPLSGYLWLVERQWDQPSEFAGPWNFGPEGGKGTPVSELVERVVSVWGSGAWRLADNSIAQPHEAGLLKLDIAKANVHLDWFPVYSVVDAVEESVAWYRRVSGTSDTGAVCSLCYEQIDRYVRAAAKAGVTWAVAH